MRRLDYYYKLAKEKGYRSRAAFKLLEIASKYRFMKKGDVIIDLGAAPGGWIQISREFVGKEGYVLGVDLVKVKPFPWKNVETLMEDVCNENIIEKIKERIPRKADCILSDLSPKVSGIWEIDHARQISLSKEALRIARKILKPKGTLFLKVFQGNLLNNFISELKESFADVRIVRPKAIRKRSAEIYILARKFKGI